MASLSPTTARLCCALVVALASLIGRPSTAAESKAEAPGARVEELLELARRLNPELGARGLETDAALARAEAAGSLGDPMLRVTSDDDRDESGGRVNKMIYSIEQEIPLWGKRELRTRIARAEAAGVRGTERATALEIEARIKSAFAQHWRAAEALRVTHEVHALLRTVAGAAQARYAQGLGTLSDAIRADVERGRLELDVAVLERDRRAARSRINALVARPAGAELAAPVGLRALPAEETLRIERLLDRAKRESPSIATASAEIEAADGNRTLVQRGWYPDVTVAAGAITREGGPNGFTAGIGLRIPLQWGLREAQAREASAKGAAARSRLQASLLTLQGQLDEALAGLAAARRSEELLATSLTPQAEAAYRSALASYQLGRSDLTAVLEAARRVRELRLEFLKTRAEAQVLLAEIERTVGGAL